MEMGRMVKMISNVMYDKLVEATGNESLVSASFNDEPKIDVEKLRELNHVVDKHSEELNLKYKSLWSKHFSLTRNDDITDEANNELADVNFDLSKLNFLLGYQLCLYHIFYNMIDAEAVDKMFIDKLKELKSK